MTAYDPAADLARRFPDWRVVAAVLPDDMDGRTEAASRTVYVDERLGVAARRSTLAHELVHVELGHDGPQPEAVEDAVEMIAAGRLIGDNEAWAVEQELSHLRALADVLAVDTGTVAAWRRGRLLAGAS